MNDRVVASAEVTISSVSDGVGIESIANHYLAYSEDHGVTHDTQGWSTEPQDMNPISKYLWSYETFVYTDGFTQRTKPHVIGVYGEDGVGIKTIKEYYLVSSENEGVDISHSDWSESVPVMTPDDNYLWKYEEIIYTNNNSEETKPVVIGVYGEKGVSITGITNYYLATSLYTGVSRSTSGWTEETQRMTPVDKYLWNYEKIEYSEGNPTYTEPAIIGVHGDKGEDGYTPVKGVDYFDGEDGQDGASSYTYIRYSQSSDGSGMTTSPINAKYIGIAVTESSTPPQNNTGYNWSKLQGDQGVEGEEGQDGRTSYLHIKYSNDGRTFTGNNGENLGAFIGMYVDFEEEDSSDPSDYTWNRIKGEKGDKGYTPVKGVDYFDGKDGQDGEDSFTYIRYSQNSNGSSMTTNPADAKYIGISVTNSSTPPQSNTDYNWSKLQGDQGVRGEEGEDGVSSFLHIKYSNDGNSFTGNNGENLGAYIGMYVDDKPGDSTDPSRYTWNRIKGEKGDKGETGTGVKETDVTYANHTSGTTSPKSGWTETPPTPNKGQYLWTRTITTYTDNSKVTTYSVAYNALDGQRGQEGADGEDGRGISDTQVRYQQSSSGVTVPTGSWSSSIPTPVKGQYLWTRTVITYTDGSTSTAYSTSYYATDGQKGDKGERGDDGISITGITEHYLVTDLSSGVTKTTDGWTTNIPKMSDDKPYLWNYEETHFSNGKKESTEPVIMGHYGSDGSDGHDGRGITEVTEYYLTSSSNSGVSRETNGWSTAMKVTTPSERYLWNYGKIEYTEGDPTYTTPVIIGVHGEKGDKGESGPQGVQGPKGDDGETTYTWIRYADDANGNGISNSPIGKDYIGLAHNKASPNETNSPTDYTWSLIRGPQGNRGVEGPKGDDGEPTFTWIKYSANSNGSGMTDTPQSNTQYIGIATNKTTQSESNTPSDYTWSLFKGPKGEKGDDGISITGVTEWYLITTQSSGVTKSTKGWTTDFPLIDESNPYLWNYEKTHFSDGTSDETEPVILGHYGADGRDGDRGQEGSDGRGITGITEYYLTSDSSSGVTQNTSGWSTALKVTTPTQPYLWNYGKIEYTYGEPTYTNPVVIGVHGQKGEKGEEGSDGQNAIVGVLDNESHTIPTDSNGEFGNYAGAHATLYIYDGATEDTDSWDVNVRAQDGIEGHLEGNTYHVTDMDIDSGEVVFTASKRGYSDVTKIFTLTKSKQGLSATMYSLDIESQVIQRDAISKEVNPQTIRVSGGKKTGDSDGYEDAYGYFVVYEQARNWIALDEFTQLSLESQVGNDEYIISSNDVPYVIRYTSENPENSLDYEIQTDAYSIVFEWYKDEYLTQILDRETIPVVSDGVSTYTHIAYATSDKGASLSHTTFDGATHIGMYVSTDTVASNNPAVYEWTLIKGKDGSQGVQGPKGDDGRTPYFHTAWANSANGYVDFSTTDSTDRAYIGTYTSYTSADSTNPSDYDWVKVKGEKGEQGPRGLTGLQGPEGKQGIQGPKGENGESTYTHIAYATSKTGANFSHDSFDTATHIGIYVSNESDSSSTASRYEWTLIKGKDGSQGLRGPEGKDGRTPYFHTAWADNSTGTSGFSTTVSTDKLYIGTATTFEKDDPTEPSVYSWTKIKGDKGDKGDRGPQGIQGPAGDDGQSQWTHIRYSANSNGSSMTTKPSSTTKYIGIAVTNSASAPTYTGFTWSKYIGEDGGRGPQGIQGPEGKDGQTTYTWVKYAEDKNGGGMSDYPEGKRFIGLAFNKTTQTESTTPSHYQWSEMPQNIEVGGRNLILGSGTPVESSAYMVAEYFISEDFVEGQEYTVTIKGTKSSAVNFGLWQNAASSSRGNFNHVKDDLYQLTFTSVATTAGNERRIRIYQPPSGTTSEATIEWIKLEKGNIATDWTEAPEDTQAKLDSKTDQEVTDDIQDELNDWETVTATKDELGEVTSALNDYLDALEANELNLNAARDDISDLLGRVPIVEEYLGEWARQWNFLDTYIRMADEGLLIQEVNGSTGIRISTDRIDFLDGSGEPVAYITNQVMRINRGIFVDSAQIGDHKIETIGDGHTIFQWMG